MLGLWVRYYFSELFNASTFFQAFEVFLVVYELMTSAEERIIYAIAHLSSYFFKRGDFEKATEFATKCMAYESLCQEGNRLFREIAKVHQREAGAATSSGSGEQMETTQEPEDEIGGGPSDQAIDGLVNILETFMEFCTVL